MQLDFRYWLLREGVTTEFLAFLRAFLSQPGDATPMLVGADWLDEHDEEPFAEYVRLVFQGLMATGEEERRAASQRARELFPAACVGLSSYLVPHQEHRSFGPWMIEVVSDQDPGMFSPEYKREMGWKTSPDNPTADFIFQVVFRGDGFYFFSMGRTVPFPVERVTNPDWIKGLTLLKLFHMSHYLSPVHLGGQFNHTPVVSHMDALHRVSLDSINSDIRAVAGERWGKQMVRHMEVLADRLDKLLEPGRPLPDTYTRGQVRDLITNLNRLNHRPDVARQLRRFQAWMDRHALMMRAEFKQRYKFDPDADYPDNI